MQLQIPKSWSILLTRPKAEHDDEDFDPSLHFTGSLVDSVEIQYISMLLLKYERDISQWDFYCPAPGMFSLEIEVSDEQQMLAFQKEYLIRATKRR